MRAHPHFNPFSIHGEIERPDWTKVFPNRQPLALEIGFSNGRWLLPFAKAHPEMNIVGLEVRKPFVDKVRQTIVKEKIPNVQVLLANANTAVPQLFGPENLALVAIFFPDPWYKKRHLKRRVITPEFLDDLARVMTKDSLLHIASDKLELSQDMRALINEHPAFQNLFSSDDWAPDNIPGFTTDIEQFHIKHNNQIYRLQYKRK
jgi:tRNA (guanine-N7-)-methyltransferase